MKFFLAFLRHCGIIQPRKREKDTMKNDTECLINPEVKAILEAMCERIDQWEKDQNERFKREREQEAKENAIRWHKEIKERCKKMLTEA